MSGAGSDPRLAAWRVLRDVDGGAHADRAARRRFAELDERDRALATRLAYGAVRLRGRLDHELGHFVDRPLPRVEPGALAWLRLGLHQLRELRVPDHAAVDQCVRGARATVGDRVTGFVNGVLRSAARHGDRAALFPDPEADPRAHLVTWGSHPDWLIGRWLERWPLPDVRRLVELDNRPPAVTARLLADAPGAAADRPGEGPPTLEPLEDWPRCARLTAGSPEQLLERLPAAVIQDPAASAVVDYVGDIERAPVLDACAAPGAKALALAWASPEARPFVAADVRPDRLRRTVRADRRVGAGLSPVAMDARRPAVERVGTVLLDAPCTGTGTLRRRPDARWRVGADRLGALVRLQRDMLDAMARVVEPGGRLVYATCSLEPEENEDQVEAFLRRHPDFVRDPRGPTADLPPDVVDRVGDLRVLPWQRETDGAYAARLRRRAA